MLGHLRLAPAERSGRRRFPEPPHPYRNDFQRDRDRIFHAQAFRRLEGKTQVFAPALSDHFRNRLTHTLEVSQIARTVAATLGLNEELTETLALAHDLGHPPFAHAGEAELHRMMQRFGARFDHNLHALRTVDTLEQRYARFDGLNLTFAVREGIVKHSREVSPGDETELQEFNPGLRPPLEAQLIDLADEIAYNTADLDDAHGSGMIARELICARVPRFAALMDRVETQYPAASARVQFREVQRQLVNDLVGGFIEGTRQAALEAGVDQPDDVPRHPVRLARFTPEALALNRQLKELLTRSVYESPELVSERSRAAVKVSELFDFLVHAPDFVSPGYREHLGDWPVHRVVCDYIAGMTDAYFLRTYEALVRSGNLRPLQSI